VSEGVVSAARQAEWTLTRQDVRQLLRVRLGRMWELPIIVAGLLVWSGAVWGVIGAAAAAVGVAIVVSVGLRRGFLRALVESGPGSARSAEWDDEVLTYVGVEGITTTYPWHVFREAAARGGQLVLSRGYGSRPLIVVQIPLRALSSDQQRDVTQCVSRGHERRIAGVV
jgi:hypothetical protein